MEEGKAIEIKNRQRKLYTNNPSCNWWDRKKCLWKHVVFDHPSNFETIGMDPKRKEEIINDLLNFKNGKDYYAKIGKAWKRGYLLYGPPGSKSSLIAAIANFLECDVYDIELTSVDISSKSLIVIEDIDCSLDITGKRKEKKKKKSDDDSTDNDSDSDSDGDSGHCDSQVTLSGLLNFIDGIWSSSGSERFIIFTTNHKEKLDPALIRRGIMDQHIEMSYCRFEAFKVLAKNYLNIDSHYLFDEIARVLEEANMSPADVVEHLMPKKTNYSEVECGDVDSNLKSLIEAAEERARLDKEEAKRAAEKEKRKKDKKEAAKLKAKEKAAKQKAEEEKEDAKAKDNSLDENESEKIKTS